jgi:hypothetical protein
LTRAQRNHSPQQLRPNLALQTRLIGASTTSSDPLLSHLKVTRGILQLSDEFPELFFRQLKPQILGRVSPKQSHNHGNCEINTALFEAESNVGRSRETFERRQDLHAEAGTLDGHGQILTIGQYPLTEG